MTTEMLIDGGCLGDLEITISYKYHKPHNGRGIEPDESATATIYWIKIGGYNGVEIFPGDDFINDEVIPHCVAHYENAE